MRSAASSSTTTCRRCAPSCAPRRRRIIGSRRSSPASCRATRFACRPCGGQDVGSAQASLGARWQQMRGVDAMFLTKKHLSRRTVLKAAGVSLELAAARRDDPRAHGARADGRRAEAARRVLLYPARRDHVEYAVRRGRRRVDAERRRRRLQVEPDPLAARELQALRRVVRQPREQGAAGLRAHDRAGHVALGREARTRRRRAR